MNIFEKKKNKIENKEIFPVNIELHFFRHSIKEKSNVDDNLIRLSDDGRNLAKEKSFKDVSLDQSVAFGSPRVRTQETALLMTFGESDNITGSESLEELKNKINKDLKFGSKIGIDDRLDTTEDFNSPVGKRANEAFVEGKYMEFLAKESDSLAEQTGDKTKANLKEKASLVGEIIEKYIKIIPRWSVLVNNKENNYSPKLERFLGTHSSIPESFIIKALQILGKDNEVEEYINKYQSGIDYLKGFDVNINYSNEEIKLNISYDFGEGKNNIEISEEQLKEIIGK